MSNRSYLAVIVLGFIALLLSMAAFTVRETDLAIKFRFGEIVRADYSPGLHFMMPLVNNVRKFDRRILTEDYPAEQFLTSEGKILRINFFVKWRITDVGRYYTSTAGASACSFCAGARAAADWRCSSSVSDGARRSMSLSSGRYIMLPDPLVSTRTLLVLPSTCSRVSK